jgi:hypothetical protein
MNETVQCTHLTSPTVKVVNVDGHLSHCLRQVILSAHRSLKPAFPARDFIAFRRLMGCSLTLFLIAGSISSTSATVRSIL